MQLKFISWNIRHFRQSKINDYIHVLWEVCNWADVVFIYEDHAGLGRTLATALNTYEATQGKPLSGWNGDEIYCMDEYVAVIWKRQIRVEHNTGAEACIGAIMSGERHPAVVDVGRDDKMVTIAAWHAYGPAKVAAKDVFQRLLCTNHCDVLIGDFNFQSFDSAHGPGGLWVDANAFDLTHSTSFQVAPAQSFAAGAVQGRRSDRLEAAQLMQEILPFNHRGSTTYTQESIGKRTTGLDRCIVKKQYVASVQLAVAQPNWFKTMWALTDHMPLMLIFEV